MINVRRVVQETDRAFRGALVYRGLRISCQIFRVIVIVPPLVTRLGRERDGVGARAGRLGLCTVRVGRELLSVCEDLLVVPGLVKVLEGTVEWCELALAYELRYYGLVPVLGTGIYALRGKVAKVDGLFMMTATGRGTVAHGALTRVPRRTESRL